MLFEHHAAIGQRVEIAVDGHAAHVEARREILHLSRAGADDLFEEQLAPVLDGLRAARPVEGWIVGLDHC